MDTEDDQAEPAVDEQGPSPVVIVIAVIAVLAVVGFGAFLITRGGDDDLTSTPATNSTEARGLESSGAVTSSSAPTSVTTTGSPSATTLSATPTSPPLATPSPTAPPPTAPPSSGGPLAIVPPLSGPPAILPPPSSSPSLVPPPSGPPAILPPPSSSPAVLPPPSVLTTTSEAAAPVTTAAPPPATAQPSTGWELADLVPNLVGEPTVVVDGAPRRAFIDALLASPRHDVASPTPVAAVCAAIALDDARRLGGRWELDSRPLGSTDPGEVGPPGFGECIVADGEAMDGGAYQFVAVDASGATSAAGTFVVGAARIDQQFRNDSGQDVCAVLVGPTSAAYYEAFRLGGGAVGPGEALIVPLADVPQDVRTVGCDDEELAAFSFDPSGEVQDLVP